MSMRLSPEQTAALVTLGSYLASLQPTLCLLSQQARFSDAAIACRHELDAAMQALVTSVRLRPDAVRAVHRAALRVLDLQRDFLVAVAADTGASDVPP